jgi:hypothetical protein
LKVSTKQLSVGFPGRLKSMVRQVGISEQTYYRWKKLRLLQYGHDLFNRKSLPLHGNPPGRSAA